MGSQPTEVDQVYTKVRKMKLLLVLALVALVKSQGEISKKFMKQIAMYNYKSACWGQKNVDNLILEMIKCTEKCMQQEPSFDVEAALMPQKNPFAPLVQQANPFKSLLSNNFDNLGSLWRNKRSASGSGFLEATQADLIDFLQDYKMWGEDLVTSIGNMTCVMQEMGLLTEDREINMEQYNNWDNTEGFDASKSLPGRDPELKEKFVTAFSDCKAIADSWPQSTLNKNPLTKAFGRNLIFFKCANKAEHMLCGMGQMYQWLEKLYGKDDGSESYAEYGLPDDKYDAAVISLMAMDAGASVEEKAVSDFFWGRF